MSLLGSWRVIQSLTNEIPVYCAKCKKIQTFKETKEDEEYTRKCGCGCEIIKFHLKDEYHLTDYFTRKYISSKEFIKDYKNKDELEKAGFDKRETKGKTIYIK